MTWHIDRTALPSAPRLRDYPQFVIEAELDKLNTIREAGLPDAAAFYAGRIVEATCTDIISRLGLRTSKSSSSESLHTTLDLIANSGRIDDGVVACANVIRRIGNHARHMDRPILAGEEPTIIALLQLWVESWIAFVKSNPGATLLQESNWSELTPLMRQLVGGEPDQLASLFDANGACPSGFIDEPTLAGFLAERTVDAVMPQADGLTQELVRRFPKVKRVQQIRALFLSRNARAAEAIKVLEPVVRWRYGDDRETLGILGGAYKNLWIETQDNAHLQRAHSYYRRAPCDGESGYYLLINAAATGLWLGDTAQARAQAYAAEENLKRYGIDETYLLGTDYVYWLTATLAEAKLLMGKVKPALRLYEHAQRTDRSGGRWKRTCTQLAVHLRYLPAGQRTDEVVGGLFALARETT